MMLDDRDTLKRATRLCPMMNDWPKSMTPEERGWMLERALQLVRNERLSADEVAELAKLIDKLDGKPKRRGKKKE